MKDVMQDTARDDAADKGTAAITVAHGDGIGPEIMEQTLRLLDAAHARISVEEIRIGETLYQEGYSSGIAPEAWDTLRRNPVLLKAPITTPQGGGYKSLNVTIRKTLGLYANVRPVRAFAPFVPSAHPAMDLIIVRENEEDLYAGIEHQQTAEVVQCLKLVSRPGCERLIRYAFELARRAGRRKLTCMTKDNIMKLSDGLFHRVFDEVATEYPELETEHYIIDIGAARLAATPERFDVVVTMNLYGDILSDIVAEIAGSVGLGGSANVGDTVAMFEAIHGSAPDIAGQGKANPAGLMQAACLMLTHLGQAETASHMGNALLRTLEDGIHTADLGHSSHTKRRVGTKAFADAVIARLGESPRHLASFPPGDDRGPIQVRTRAATKPKKQLVGVDVFLDWDMPNRQAAVLGKALEALTGDEFQLKMVTNRGVKVYPGGFPETFCTDHWRCRFVSCAARLSDDGSTMLESKPLAPECIPALLLRIAQAGFHCIKTEHLYEFDGERGYSLGQGE
ncbi:NADP-dependent isocitrate dehydrogenase [Algiphilus sp.]|uniref:NADP-dependent isocitrate dehydrogenase n=1 Tax=Algiphilus sp. TaxID=1872431 RepID=UPI003B52DA51